MLVANILREAGKPTETSKLVKMLAEKLNITTTHAYRLVKKAWENKEIRKVTLPDRSVLCGLPEWPFPTYGSNKLKQTASFQDAFLYKCFNELDKIAKDIINNESGSAYLELKAFQAKQPKTIQDKFQPHFQEYQRKVNNINKVYSGPYLGEGWRIGNSAKRIELLELLSKISEILHEQAEKENAE